MSDLRPERDWFEKADQDLEMARRALGAGTPLPAMACYHSQQTAEKYLKGYLVAHSIPFRYVHDLVYLIQLCMEEEPALGELMPAVESLNEYGTAMRYPEESSPGPTVEAAKEALKLAEQVVAAICRGMECDCSRPDGQDAPPTECP